MEYKILIDFGSTFTKLCVFDLENQEVVLATKYPSTVKKDASIGLQANLNDAKKIIGDANIKKAQFLASSSAAGGLRMVVVGLTPNYSLMAGKNVALGAGARIIKTYSYKLSQENIKEIEEINPEILLLCGGIENGNTDCMLENAEKLAADSKLQFPIVYGGNSCIAKEIRSCFVSRGKECFIAENIFPSLNQLVTAPTDSVIRNIFMKRITNMKGLNKVKNIIGEVLMPTPAAVLAGGKLLSEGIDGQLGLGKTLIFDIGGATTDVYSYIENTSDNVKIIGSPEPKDKRTVEGDLGLRSSAYSLAKTVGIEYLSKTLKLEEEIILNSCKYRSYHEDYIAQNAFEKNIDFNLAKSAIYVSARRHGGHIENAYSKGAMEIQTGKNLSKIQTIVGTGGPIINSLNPREVLSCALKTSDEKITLLPQNVKFYLDKKYLLYAVGLLAQIDPKNSFAIAKNCIVEI